LTAWHIKPVGSTALHGLFKMPGLRATARGLVRHDPLASRDVPAHCKLYGIKSESEITSRFILKTAKKKKTKSSDADAIRTAMRSLRKEARSCCNDGTDGEHAFYAKASAWYLTLRSTQNTGGRYNEGFERRHLISFPWCLCDRLISIKKAEQPAQEDEA
jgi:hypothetical protein